MDIDNGYDTIEEAARGAIHNIAEQKDGATREYIGLIYEDPKTGQFLFTPPKSSGRRASTKGTFAVPKGSARAIYHNHPLEQKGRADDRRSHFSVNDIDVAKNTKLRSFIGVDNDIYYWDPASPGTLITNHRKVIGGKGTLVEFPTESVLAEIDTDQLPSHRTPSQRIATRGWTTTGGVLAPKSPPKGLLGGIQDKVTPDLSQKKVN